jgi:exodeoxyribonuclease VII large subunit
MEEAGFGALQRQFEQLKAKLGDEGLFDPDKKRPVPASTGHIGIITSTTGAAIKDILSVLKRRFPAIKISIFPTAVQGDEAPAQIVKALADANSCHNLDALIISRGGGSLEDLWSFNTEEVARAIAASRLPTISAVGHEIDFTIADFVSDLRAPTPSAAAELISPDGQQMYAQFGRYQSLLNDIQRRILNGYQQQLGHLQKRLQHPGTKLQQQAQHLDHLDIRLRRAISAKLDSCRSRGDQLTDKLCRQNPRHQVEEKQQQLSLTLKQLKKAILHKQERLQLRLAQSMHLLDTVSPLKTLGRGYAVIRNTQGEVINSVDGVNKDDSLTGQLGDGQLLLTVTAKNNKTLG